MILEDLQYLFNDPVQDQRITLTHITYYNQIISATKSKRFQKASKTKEAEEPKQILKQSRQKELIAYTAKLCIYCQWEESELVQQKRFDLIRGDKVVPNHQEDNHYYQKVMVAEIKDRITKEELWINKNLL